VSPGREPKHSRERALALPGKPSSSTGWMRIQLDDSRFHRKAFLVYRNLPGRAGRLPAPAGSFPVQLDGCGFNWMIPGSTGSLPATGRKLLCSTG
jgi:hypothetical protein